MTFLLVVLMLGFFLVALVLIGTVLLQEGKGGGLTMAAGMDGVMGARNPLRKITAWSFVLFVCLAVGINKFFAWRSSRAVQLPEAYEPAEPGLTPPPLPLDFGPQEETEPSSLPGSEAEASVPLPVPTEGVEAAPETPVEGEETPAAPQ